MQPGNLASNQFSLRSFYRAHQRPIIVVFVVLIIILSADHPSSWDVFIPYFWKDLCLGWVSFRDKYLLMDGVFVIVSRLLLPEIATRNPSQWIKDLEERVKRIASRVIGVTVLVSFGVVAPFEEIRQYKDQITDLQSKIASSQSDVAAYSEALRQLGNNTVRDFIGFGRKAFELGDYTNSVAFFEKAMNDPSSKYSIPRFSAEVQNNPIYYCALFKINRLTVAQLHGKLEEMTNSMRHAIEPPDGNNAYNSRQQIRINMTNLMTIQSKVPSAETNYIYTLIEAVRLMSTQATEP
jgi:hypothetical protein